jgi:hypothetical protein
MVVKKVFITKKETATSKKYGLPLKGANYSSPG